MAEPAGWVTVDGELCAGSGFCLSVAPEVFSMPPGQERATAVEGALTGDQLELAREAQSLCPLSAIRIELVG
jgi:ferredoxin